MGDEKVQKTEENEVPQLVAIWKIIDHPNVVRQRAIIRENNYYDDQYGK